MAECQAKIETQAEMKTATPTKVEVAAQNQTRQQTGFQAKTNMGTSAETSVCPQPGCLPTCVDPMLPDVYYLHGLFPTEFLDELRELMDTLVTTLPPSIRCTLVGHLNPPGRCLSLLHLMQQQRWTLVPQLLQPAQLL